MRHTPAAAALAVLLAACSTAAVSGPPHYALVPIKSNGQQLAGLDSRTILESRQPSGIVSVRADAQFADFGASFIVAVHNKSGGALEFGPKNIAASINGKALPVLAAEELDARVKGQARGFIRATSRTGNVDIAQASAEANREYRFNNWGGCPAGQGGCAVFSDDGGRNYRQDRINRQTEAETVAEVAAKLQASATLIAQKALRTTSIAPEQIGGGVMVVQPPATGGPVDLTITFNGQQHRFTFNARPIA